MMRRLLGCALLLVSLVATAADPAAPTYTADLGPHKFQTATLKLHDSQRNKDIPIKIYYPEGTGPFPVIVFSHGLYGSKDGYFALGQYWASHGYVSIHPSHEDSLADGNYRGGLRKLIADPYLWVNRPRDISLVLDSLNTIEKQVPALKGKLDRERIGVGGHSYGAYTTQAIGGATVQMPDEAKPRSFADPRVKAIIIMSPQGEGQMGMNAHSWDNVRLPMLCMYGSLDFGSQRQTPTWRSQPFYNSPAGDKYDIEIEGATHMTFPGPMREGRKESDLFRDAKVATLAFWDAYLKQDAGAKRWLMSDALDKFSGGKARLDRK